MSYETFCADNLSVNLLGSFDSNYYVDYGNSHVYRMCLWRRAYFQLLPGRIMGAVILLLHPVSGKSNWKGKIRQEAVVHIYIQSSRSI